MFNPQARWDRPAVDRKRPNHQPIEVVAQFGPGKIRPLYFTLNNHRYDIERINYFWKDYRGRERLYCFSASNGANTFQIYFSNQTLSWKLVNIE